MDLKTLRALYQIAERLSLAAIESKLWWQPLKQHRLKREIYSLAAEVRGCRLLHDEEVLSSFFTTDACRLLMGNVNEYWFWLVVKESAGLAEGNSPLLRIGPELVEEASQRLSRDLMVAYPASRLKASLTSSEQILDLALGIIVLKEADGVIEPVRNPIFADGSN